MFIRADLARALLCALLVTGATLTAVNAYGRTLPVSSDILTGYTSIAHLQEKYGMRAEYDRLLQKFTLVNDGHTVVVSPGTEYILVDHSLVKMSGKARLVRGQIQIPADVIPEIEKHLGQPLPRPQLELMVVIDAGHGGKDPGALRNRLKMDEKDINLDLAKRVKKVLVQDGFKVAMTRETDVFLELEERCLIANKARADVFICIHVNSARNSVASGVEVFYPQDTREAGFWAGKRPDTFQSPPNAPGEKAPGSPGLNDVLFDALCEEYRIQSKELAEEIHGALVSSLGAVRRGARCDKNLHVLRSTSCTSVLVEVGFISNRKEEERLNDPAYRDRVTRAIASGLNRFRRKLEERLAKD